MSVLGLADGGALGLALILPVLRARTGQAVAAFTAMTLCFGYSIAAAGPWILGLAHDLTGSWTVPLLVLIE
jgi:CP family cyanate transporter-like MFS transporter